MKFTSRAFQSFAADCGMGQLRDSDLMTSILNRPLLVFVVSMVVLWISVQVGNHLRRKTQARKEEELADLGMVVNAALTLLALIIGFSFSMAVTRYDQRKNYEEEEANAIGTEYVRAALLPDADAEKIRELLKQYVHQRLLFYTVRDSNELQGVDNQTSQLQNEMWNVVQRAGTQTPTPTVALVVSGMNDVLNSQGYTQAAWWNRIPEGAWALMGALAICCSLLVGFGAQRRRHGILITVLPFLLSIAFFLIADIDSPRRGVIRVVPLNLSSLDQSLHQQ